MAQSDSAVLCATVKQPISAGIDGGSLDFQLYTGVSVDYLFLCSLDHSLL